MSWTATALPSIDETQQLGHNLTNTEKSLISSFAAIGALVASPVTGHTMNHYGRKLALLSLCTLAIPGWATLAAGTKPLHLYLGRMLTGIYSGGCTIVVPVYVKELSSPTNRGVLGCLFMLMICMGKLVS